MSEDLLRRTETHGEDENAKYHAIEWHEISTGELVKRQPTVHLKKGLCAQGVLNFMNSGG
jgi:hypothetical protein